MTQEMSRRRAKWRLPSGVYNPVVTADGRRWRDYEQAAEAPVLLPEQRRSEEGRPESRFSALFQGGADGSAKGRVFNGAANGNGNGLAGGNGTGNALVTEVLNGLFRGDGGLHERVLDGLAEHHGSPADAVIGGGPETEDLPGDARPGDDLDAVDDDVAGSADGGDAGDAGPADRRGGAESGGVDAPDDHVGEPWAVEEGRTPGEVESGEPGRGDTEARPGEAAEHVMTGPVPIEPADGCSVAAGPEDGDERGDPTAPQGIGEAEPEAAEPGPRGDAGDGGLARAQVHGPAGEPAAPGAVAPGAAEDPAVAEDRSADPLDLIDQAAFAGPAARAGLADHEPADGPHEKEAASPEPGDARDFDAAAGHGVPSQGPVRVPRAVDSGRFGEFVVPWLADDAFLGGDTGQPASADQAGPRTSADQAVNGHRPGVNGRRPQGHPATGRPGDAPFAAPHPATGHPGAGQPETGHPASARRPETGHPDQPRQPDDAGLPVDLGRMPDLPGGTPVPAPGGHRGPGGVPNAMQGWAAVFVEEDDERDWLDRPNRPPRLETTRPYGRPGGLEEPDPDAQARLVQAVSGRFPDPRGTWIRLINAEGPTEDPFRSTNALDCSLAVISTWHGEPVVAARRLPEYDVAGRPLLTGEIGGVARAEEWLGHRFEYVGHGRRAYVAIAQRLVFGGHGAAAVLITRWPGGGSHAWNAVNCHGEVLWIDAQRGHMAVEPPYEDVTGVFCVVIDRQGRAL